MIRLEQGNLLEADVEALVNTVNTVGVMGKGIALQFKRAYPENFKIYARACKSGDVQIGRMLLTETGALENPRYVVNFPTKKHWRSASRLEYIQAGLHDLRSVITTQRIRSIAVPPLGCGNGGLDWTDVYPVIHAALADLEEVRVLVFAPAGTPKASAMPIRTPRPRMTPARAALMLAFASYIQRSVMSGLAETSQMSIVEAQKVAYFLQVAGWPGKLDFVPSHYGPYAHSVDQFISHVEGHFITGYGDGSSGSRATLELDAAAIEDAHHLLGEDVELQVALRRLGQIVDGFEFPYGVELLATVHYVASHGQHPNSVESITSAIKSWSERKGRIFHREQVELAHRHLVSTGLS